MRPRATIQAVDTNDETWYVLVRDGLPVVVAHWPDPLLELAPDAIRLPTIDMLDRNRLELVVSGDAE